LNAFELFAAGTRLDGPAPPMPESVAPSFYIGFLAFVALMLALDLGVFNRKAHAPSFRESLGWVGVWTSLALCFGVFVAIRYGGDAAMKYYAAWLIEQSLSIDNIFVFVVIFTSLKVPLELQHRVLYWGIVTAVVLRAAMIFGGVWLIQRFDWVLYIFGAFLVLTGIKLLLRRAKEAAHGGHRPDPTGAEPAVATLEAPEKVVEQEGRMLRMVRRLIPTVGLHGSKFFVRVDGRMRATTLLLALVLVEITDVMFAVDSIPAVFAVTTNEFLVFTSNIFAILGLRSLYFVLAGMHNRFAYLEPGLGIVLCFVGAKLLLHGVFAMPTWVSLSVILVVLGGAISLSLLRAKYVDEAARS
jgi:tellurite resistance protein TerC